MGWRTLMFVTTWLAQASLPLLMLAMLVAGLSEQPPVTAIEVGSIFVALVFGVPGAWLLGLCLVCTTIVFLLARYAESALVSAIVLTVALLVLGLLGVGYFAIAGPPPLGTLAAIVLSFAVIAIWPGAVFLFVTWVFRRLGLDAGFDSNFCLTQSKNGAREGR